MRAEVVIAVFRRVNYLCALVLEQELVFPCQDEISHDFGTLQHVKHVYYVQVVVQLLDPLIQIVLLLTRPVLLQTTFVAAIIATKVVE